MIHESGCILANKYKGAHKSCRKSKAFIKAEKERDKDIFYQKAQKYIVSGLGHFPIGGRSLSGTLSYFCEPGDSKLTG